MSDGYPERKLFQFTGSGDYVTVEATIAGIEYVKKEVPEMPDLKGVLSQQNTTKKLPFVVEDGATHPYFEPGQRYRFEGVKDHLYEQKKEVQALITKQTNVLEL